MSSRIIQLIWEDTVALSIAAAHHFVTTCNMAIADKGKFTVALSGGNTPKTLFQILATPAFSRNIDWKKVLLFWSDERFVPHTHPDSNYKMAKDALIDHIKIPKKNIFPIPTKGEATTCAKQYQQTLQRFLGKSMEIDLTLLGMGSDGHTASLFPGTTILKEKKKFIKEVWVPEKETFRISFTYPLINKSKAVMLLVADDSKTKVLKQIFGKKKMATAFPVQGVHPTKGNVIWMLDEAAAKGIYLS